MQDRRKTLLLLAVGAAFLLSAVATGSHQHSKNDPPDLCPACVHASASAVISETIAVQQPLHARAVDTAASTSPVVQAVFTASERGPPLTIE